MNSLQKRIKIFNLKIFKNIIKLNIKFKEFYNILKIYSISFNTNLIKKRVNRKYFFKKRFLQ
jgi:hypothetical protein